MVWFLRLFDTPNFLLTSKEIPMDIGQLYKEHHADSHAAALQMIFDAGKKIGFAQGHAAALAELPAVAPV